MAAKTIAQRITLEGAEAVQQKLKAIGDTGERSFRQVKDASNEAGDAAAGAGDGALSFGEKAVAAAGLIGVLAIAAYKLGKAFLSSAEDAAKNANAVANAATRSGQSLQAYQEQIVVLQKFGFSAAEAEQIVKKFGDAAAASYKKAADGLKDMGVRFAPGEAGAEALNDQLARTGAVVKNIADARDPVAQLNNAMAASKGIFDANTGAVTTDIAAWQRFVEVIRAIQDPLVRSKALTLAFTEEQGRLFNEKVIQGKTPLAEFLAEFQREGGALQKEQAKVAADFQKAFDDFNRIRTNAGRDQGLQFAAILTPIIAELNRVIPIVNTEIERLIAEASKPLKGQSVLEAITGEIPKVLSAIGEQISATFSAVWEALKSEVPNVFSAIGQTIAAIFSGIWSGVSAAASSMWQQIQQDAQTAVNFIVGIWERVKQAISSVPSANNTAGAPLGDVQFAGGGYTGNRHVSRIAGFVHGQEYVEPAHVVRQPGVLNFLEMLRRSGGDLNAVLLRFQGYSMGGFVDGVNRSLAANFSVPGIRGFADGGLDTGGGMSNVTIQFPGQPDIVGLRASSGVVGELRKAAAMAKVRSGGRKPSRYG